MGCIQSHQTKSGDNLPTFNKHLLSGCKKLEAMLRKSSKHPFRVDTCVSFQVDIYPIELIGKDMCSLQMGDSTTERCFFGGFTSMLLFMKRRERQVERIRHSFSPHKQKKVWKDSKVKPSTIKAFGCGDRGEWFLGSVSRYRISAASPSRNY